MGFTEVQFLRNPILATSDIYEKQLAFFENVKPEELLISVRDFQNNIKMTWEMLASVKIQYLTTFLCW